MAKHKMPSPVQTAPVESENPPNMSTSPKAAETMQIQGVTYKVVSMRDNGQVVELENPVKKGEDGKPVTFFYSLATQQKLTKVGDTLSPARGRMPGTKSPRRSNLGSRGRSGDVSLNGQARVMLGEYVDLKGGEADQVVSELVLKHLGDEVRKARELADRRKKLPADLIDALASADEKTRQTIMGLLQAG